MISKGMKLCFADMGDSFAEVVRADPDGSCALYYGWGIPLDYAPGVIQQGIADGEILIMEER